LRAWTIGGCIASFAALGALAVGGLVGTGFPLQVCVFVLGVANGAFAVAAIGSMMELAGQGRSGREGTRMGLWGAAQAIAFGIGGFAGALASDIARSLLADSAHAYATVFAAEALLFLLSARLAAKIVSVPESSSTEPRLAFAASPERG
jgi:BCD family chlorophyll transporter-like MFS transporter